MVFSRSGVDFEAIEEYSPNIRTRKTDLMSQITSCPSWEPLPLIQDLRRLKLGWGWGWEVQEFPSNPPMQAPSVISDREAPYHHLKGMLALQSWSQNCSQARLTTPNLLTALPEVKADWGSVCLAQWLDYLSGLTLHSQGRNLSCEGSSCSKLFPEDGQMLVTTSKGIANKDSGPC